MIPGHRIGRNAAAKLLGEAASKVGGLLFYFLLARWLGPEAFGRYSVAFSYAVLFAVLVDLGTNVIITREIARRPAQLAELAPRVNGLKLAASALYLAVLAVSLRLSLQASDDAGLTLALGLLVAGTMIFESLNAMLSGLERMWVEALSKAINKLALLMGAACGFWATGTLMGTVAGVLAGTAVSLIAAYVLLARLGAPAEVAWDGPWNRLLLAQSLPLVVSWTFWNLYDNQDVLVLAYMGLPVIAVGHFAAAMKVIDALRGLPVLITGAMFPLLATRSADEPKRFTTLAEFLLKTVLSIALPIALGGAALASSVVHWIYGPGFEPAADVLRVAIWAVIGIFVNHALIILLVALDLQRRTIVGAAGAAIANLAALLLLVGPFGLPGAAAALVISEGVFLVINLGTLHGRRLGIWKPVATHALKPLAALIAMAATLRWVVPAWHPLAAVAMALGVYTLILVVVRGLPGGLSEQPVP